MNPSNEYHGVHVFGSHVIYSGTLNSDLTFDSRGRCSDMR